MLQRSALELRLVPFLISLLKETQQEQGRRASATLNEFCGTPVRLHLQQVPAQVLQEAVSQHHPEEMQEL